MHTNKNGWHLEIRSLSDLNPYLKNPRQISEEDADQLKQSILKFGLTDKPNINTDNTIIGGHQRLAILRDLAYEEVECWVPNRTLDSSEVEELCLRLNRNHGEWDWDILANDFDENELKEWGFNHIDIPSMEIEPNDTIDEPEEEEYCSACNQKIKKKKKHGKTRKRDQLGISR